MTAIERKARVDDAIAKVGLNHCRKTIIGDPMRKGVSGGERKRVCVAMELLTHPRLLFLDEPTSGLDSVTALSLTRTLKQLADEGNCTVICTIHQPQTKIYELFDDLMLLKGMFCLPVMTKNIN
jgi:ATP-binding cassette subfamily G (WHITE) protein 2